jgi:hypothetical protein
MKSLLSFVLMTLVLSGVAQAEEFDVKLLGESWVLSGNVHISEEAGIWKLEKVSIRSANSGDTYLLAVGLGWGAQPLDTLCEQVTNGKWRYATSYGNVREPGFFTFHEFLRVSPDDHGNAASYQILDKEDVSLYYANLTCTRTRWDTGE